LPLRCEVNNTSLANIEDAGDNYSATRGLSGTALPNANAGAAGGLPTDSTGKTSFNDATAAAVRSEIDSNSTQLAAIVQDTSIDIPLSISNLNDLSSADVASAVYNASTSSYSSAGSFGLLIKTNLDAAVSTAGGDSAATIWSYATRVLTANTNLNDLDSAEVRSAVGLATANLDTQLSDIDSVVDSIVIDTGTDIPASIAAISSLDEAGVRSAIGLSSANLDATLTEIKGSTFDTTTDSLEAIRDRGDSDWVTGGSGSGLYTLTVTVEDSGGSVLQGAKVNVSGTTLTATTGANGQVTFNLDAGTYSLLVLPPAGYATPSNTSVTISANATQTIVLSDSTTTDTEGWI
jgi:hypothetical protein